MNATEGESWWIRPVAGALSSQTAEFCTFPIDTSKTRLQMSGKGFSAAFLRQGVYRSLVFAMYEPLRDGLDKLNLTAKAGEDASAGFTAAVVSAPVDLIKTRLMNQSIDPLTGKGTEYKGMLDVAGKIIKSEGVLSLYKGFIPTWLRLGPYTLIAFMTFEQYRKGLTNVSNSSTYK
eukprot:gene31585-39015_t